MIEALQRLQQHLNDNHTRGRSYEILSFMATECLARPHATEKLRFEAKAFLTGCGTASEQIMDAKNWVPAIETLRRALHLAQEALPDLHHQRHRIGEHELAQDHQESRIVSQRRGAAETVLPGATQHQQKMDDADPRLEGGADALYD